MYVSHFLLIYASVSKTLKSTSSGLISLINSDKNYQYIFANTWFLLNYYAWITLKLLYSIITFHCSSPNSTLHSYPLNNWDRTTRYGWWAFKQCYKVVGWAVVVHRGFITYWLGISSKRMVDFMLMAVKKARQRLPMEVGTCSCITCFLRAKVPIFV